MSKAGRFTKRRIMASTCLLFLLVAGLCVADFLLSNHGPVLPIAGQQCGWMDTQVVGEYAANNDVWRAQMNHFAPEDFRQCMGKATGENGTISVSFTWNYARPGQGVIAYPHVQYGLLGGNISTTPRLPLPVEELGALKAYSDYDVNASSPYNVSYDLWLSNHTKPNKPEIDTEIMIWLDRHNMQQASTKIDTIQVDGHAFDVYIRPVEPNLGQWQYIAFVAREPVNQSWIDLRPFFRYLHANKLTRPKDYIDSIQFGAEIRRGWGSFKINNFRIINE